MANTFHVGMADLVVVTAPDVLVTLGLGSCIGLVIYDSVAKVAGMAHIMLPESRGGKESTIDKPGKFADTAVPALIDAVCKRGALRSRLKAKFAGGAQMFSIPGAQTDFLAVGSRNVRQTSEWLNKYKIKIVATDTGGNRGRSVEFSTETWVLSIKTLGQGNNEI